MPESFSSLIKLKQLSLIQNQLTLLPTCLKALTQLEELSFGYNHITSLPEGKINLSNLKSLYLMSNKIKEIPDEISKLNLLILNLAHNNICTLSKNRTLLASVFRINLEHNPLPREEEARIYKAMTDLNHIAVI